jgi:hypothetical protein
VVGKPSLICRVSFARDSGIIDMSSDMSYGVWSYSVAP